MLLQELGLPYGGMHSPWNRLSGVRFSWKMITTCWIFEAGGGGGGGVLPPPQPFRLKRNPAVQSNRIESNSHAERLMVDALVLSGAVSLSFTYEPRRGTFHSVSARIT